MAVEFTKEQQAVIDARDCNILVSAAAGSGKTAVLVERIIQMITSDMDIDHLLVVTFTKAAASQMREKITLAIADKLKEDPDNKHLQKQETLIHNAQITTIDSFCQYVVKNNFNALGIDPSFRVGDDGELRLLQEEVMQDLLEEEYQLAGDNAGSDFLYCMEYFSTGHSDKQVEEYIQQLYRFAMSMPWPEDWIRERAGDYDIESGSFNELSWVKDCVEMGRRELQEIVESYNVAVKICEEPDGPYMYAQTLEEERDSFEAALKKDSYDGLFDGLRTISYGKLSPKKDDSVDLEKREYVKELREKIKKRLTKLIDTYFALPSEIVVEQMKLCDRAIRELCRLTIRYKEIFDGKKRDKLLIDFSDMEHFALQILVEHPAIEECEGLSVEEILEKCTPSPVALEYRDFYREVLIDEYQDSNNVQELILKSISGDLPEKSERFMVGDVKQSIYKFRLARPEIFMDKLHTYDKETGAKDHRIDLHKNFRSRSQVLEITNYIFEKIMGKDLGSVEYDEDARLVTGATYPEPSMDVTPELIFFDSQSEENEALSKYDAKQREALVISSRIHELLRENSDLHYKDIVILLRSLAGWDDVFKQVLADQGIPAYIESKSGYFDAPEVAIMLDMLSVIDNPSQDIRLVSVMHSCIGGFSDEELASLRVKVNQDEVLYGESSFYNSLRLLDENTEHSDRKLADFISLIENARDMSVYTPVHELLQFVIDETSYDTYCTALPYGGQRKANLDMLLSMALSFEKSSFKGLFHFVRYVEHMKVAQVDYGEAGLLDENADVVRIMSIHKSKGLEFPVVFVSGTSKGFNEMDIKKDLIADMDFGLGVRCIDLEHRVKYDTLKRLIIADKMKTDNLGEELRVLYVALTRAKEKLILTAAVKDPATKITQLLRKVPTFVESGTLLPYSARSGAGSYFDLVLASIIRHPGFEEALDKLELPKDIYDNCMDKGDVPQLRLKVLTEDDIAAGLLKKDVTALISRDRLISDTLEFDEELAGRLLAKFESRYAYENLKGLFTKTTVTELKKHMLEEQGEVFDKPADYGAEYEDEVDGENQNDAVHEDGVDATTQSGSEYEGTADSDSVSESEKQSSHDMPDKSSEMTETDRTVEKVVKKKLTGAERGTAYHRIMEILDDAVYGDEELMKAALVRGADTKQDDVSKKLYGWLTSKADEKVIPAEYKECVWTPDVAIFLSTELGQRMGQAYRNGKLMREKPFMMGISASDLDPKFPQEEMVLIQGIIDAWFIEDGEIVLMDYKTDRVKEPEELVRRYQIQLDLYKRALESSTKMKVKEVYIYSFGLGCQIKL